MWYLTYFFLAAAAPMWPPTLLLIGSFVHLHLNVTVKAFLALFLCKDILNSFDQIYFGFTAKQVPTLDWTLQKNKESQPTLFLIQAFLNLKNQIFLKKRPPRSKTVTRQGHKGRKNFGWENFFYLISRQIGQF